MTHRDRHQIAARLVRSLRARGFLTAKAGDLAEIVAQEIEAACADIDTGTPERRATYLAEAVATMKREIRAIIPPAFGWWLEFDHDVRASIRWVWLGHPAVTRCGSVSDSDFSLALHFLRSVDWEEEVRRAMADIEKTEADLLRQAQERRRLILTNGAHMLSQLPPLELPPPPPATFEDKRLAAGPLEIPAPRLSGEEARERIRSAIEAHQEDEAGSSRPALPSSPFSPSSAPAGYYDEDEEDDGPEPEPPPPLPPVATVAPPIPTGERRPRFPDEPGKPRLVFGLSRERSRLPLAFVKFEPFDSLRELSAAVKAAPPDTYAQAFLHGGEIVLFGADKVWSAFGIP